MYYPSSAVQNLLFDFDEFGEIFSPREFWIPRTWRWGIEGEGEGGEGGTGRGGEEDTNYSELCQLLFSFYFFIIYNRFNIANSRHPQPSVLIQQLLPRYPSINQ